MRLLRAKNQSVTSTAGRDDVERQGPTEREVAAREAGVVRTGTTTEMKEPVTTSPLALITNQKRPRVERGLVP